MPQDINEITAKLREVLGDTTASVTFMHEGHVAQLTNNIKGEEDFSRLVMGELWGTFGQAMPSLAPEERALVISTFLDKIDFAIQEFVAQGAGQ